MREKETAAATGTLPGGCAACFESCYDWQCWCQDWHPVTVKRCLVCRKEQP